MGLDAFFDVGNSPVLRWLRGREETSRGSATLSPTRGDAIDELLSPLIIRDSREYSASQEVLQAIRGYGVPLLGAVGGYMASDTVGGAGAGMALTSYGMALLESTNDQTPRMAVRGYQLGTVLGSVMGIIYALAHHGHH